MEVGKLITSQQQVNNRLDQMEGKFNSTAKSVDRAEKSFLSLSRVATALSAAISVQQIASYGNSWVTVSNKLVNAVRANEDLFTVTNRVFDISQNTRAGLEATATLYGRLERATRSAGTSTADLAKLTTTINKGLVVSGATAEEASSTMIQLSQALASGVLRGEEFNSISENGSRLAVALADSLGVTVGQLRAMAAEGKLTTDVVVNGLLKQSDAIAKEFGNTVLTMGQSFTVASNNITKFIGESSSVNTALNIFNQGVISLSENLGTIANIIGVVAAVVGSRYVGALVLATASQVRLAAAAYSAAASQGALATAAKVASGALALVGGPAGFATLAATAIFYFYQKAQEAKKEAIDLADGVNALIAKMKEMSNVQLAAEIGKLNNSLPELSAAVDDAKKVYDKATEAVERNRRQIYLWGEDSIIGGQAADELKVSLNNQAIALNDLTKIQNTHGQAVNGASILSAQLNGTLVTGIDLLRRDGQEASFVTGMMNKLGQAINVASGAKERFNSTSLSVKRDPKAQKVLDDLYQQNELLAQTDLRKRAQLKTEQELRALGADEPTIRIGREQAGAAYDKQAAQAALKKETAAATKEEAAAEAAEKRRVKSLQDLSNEMAVAELKTKGLNREAAQLAAVQDLGTGASQQQIQQATQQAGQIFDIQQRMADKKAAIDADSVVKAEQQRKLDLSQLDRQLAAGDISFEQSQQRRVQIAADYSKSIAEASAAKSVTPQQELAAQVDPVQALANENARKLALIQQFTQQKVITEQQGLALMNAANNQYEQQRTAAQWELLSQQSLGFDMLTSAVDSFSGNASNAITGLLTGTMSVSDAMRSLGNTILNQVINGIVQMGVEWVKNLIIQKAMGTAVSAASAAEAVGVAAAWAPAAAMASLATLGANAAPASAGITSTVGLATGLAVSGMRKNGGPVSAGSMYQVGEGGLPEIYQASNGKQYMIPGDNGSVVSNKDMNGGSGQINVTMNFENYSSGATVDAQAQSDGKGGVTIQAIVYDISQGGPVGQAISTFHNAPRRATN
ncbi:tape measure protein [Yersinia rochesterensis]|nr:tape measure protein [Yersinia rochesterensis]